MIAGWGSVAIAVLVFLGSTVLLHTARSAGRRERRRAGDIEVVPLMTLPGFASALFLATGGVGLLGWLGHAADTLVDGAFGLWWFSNAVVMGHLVRLRRVDGWSLRALMAVLAMVFAIAAGVWFFRLPVVWVLRS